MAVMPRQKIARKLGHVVLLGASLVVSGCADGWSSFPIDDANQAELPDYLRVILLNDANILEFRSPNQFEESTTLPDLPEWDYRVGNGDILSITVFNHPELTMPAGTDRSSAETGFRVQSDGSFFYPFVGRVQASGRRVDDIRLDLADRLADFLADPQIEVRVAGFNSQAINTSGEVMAPQRQSLTTVPLRLIDAINSSQGLLDSADPSAIKVQRNGISYNVNLERFLTRGDQSSNPILISGDVVFVPPRQPEEVFILGEVVRPDTLDLDGEDVTLTAAIAGQGGLNEIRADARGIFVFRQTMNGVDVFQLDVRSPSAFVIGANFPLFPGDIVYVTRSPLQRWNDTIASLLPSIGFAQTGVDLSADR